MDILRDPIWQFIGAAIGIITFLFTVIVEWPNVRNRFSYTVHAPKQLAKLVIGAIGGFSSGVLGGLTFSFLLNEIGRGIGLFNDYELFSMVDVLYWGLGWGAAGIIFSILGVEKSTTFKDGLNGSIFGALLAIPVGMLISYIIAYSIWYNDKFSVALEISGGLGAAVSMILFGFIYGGFIKKIAKLLLKNWIKDV